MQIGKRIKYERERIGMTQLELGKIVGVSAQCVSGWEVGRITPDAITLNKIAQICKVDISIFLSDNDNNATLKAFAFNSSEGFRLTKTEMLIISKLRTLPAEKRRAFEIILGIQEKK